jgi:hypothetical protein
MKIVLSVELALKNVARMCTKKMKPNLMLSTLKIVLRGVKVARMSAPKKLLNLWEIQEKSLLANALVLAIVVNTLTEMNYNIF